MRLSTILLTVVALARAHQLEEASKRKDILPKRSYVCPPNFVRLSHRCYFFSEDAATWQDAYFKCRDLQSNLAIIKNANQDRLIRRTLSKKTLAPLERWLGGLYDWEQMRWKWGASGKPLVYQGFSQMAKEDKEKLQWHCIIVDPKLQFKWNTRNCLDEKHFICHTKIKIVTNKGKKKLLRQYNVNKYNKLNEIPVPVHPGDGYNSSTSRLKDGQINAITLDISNDLGIAQFASKTKAQKRRKGRRYRKRKKMEKMNWPARYNSTVAHEYGSGAKALEMGRRRRNKSKEDKDTTMEHIRWKTYYKDATLSPLHPKAIVEEFNYVKEQ